MRSYRLFTLVFWLHCVFFSYAQRYRPESNGPPPDELPRPMEPPPAKTPPQVPSVPKAQAPGAIAVGQEPYIAPKDEETDVAEIAEKLKDLIEDIIDLVDAITHTSTSVDDSGSRYLITTVPTKTGNAFPASASGCAEAYNYFDLCSRSYANFTALPATSQAGCLCNVYSGADFNGNMQSCYQYIAPQNHTKTQFQSYATAVANGTALCASTYAALSTPIPIASPAPSVASPTYLPSTGGVSSCFDRGSSVFLMVALWVALVSVSWG